MLLALAMLAAACGDDGGGDSADTGDGDDAAADDDDDGDDAAADDDDGDDAAADDDGDDAADDDGDDAPAEIATGFGVDAENKVIRVGINGDLSGPFASLVVEIVAGQEVYWEVFNEAGGYEGWTVETVIIDSGYATDVGIQNYEELAQESDDGVLMITENTGSPITAAIAEQAAEDNMLVIPLSWASLWPDPEFGATILEKQTTYCIESMNGVAWLADMVEGKGETPALAIIGRPGEYGEDGSVGAARAAELLGIPVVYDGTSAVAGDDRTAIVAEVVGSGANMVWTTLTPGETLDIFGNSVSQGFRAYWSGNSPSFNYLVHLGSDFAEQFDEFWFHSYYQAPWATPGIPEMENIVAEMTARRPDLNISDVYTTGWIEGMMAETLIKAAVDGGDLTRPNMVALSQSGLEVDFGGLSANQSWPQDYNEAVVRSSWIYDVDLTAFDIKPLSEYTAASPGGTGLVPIEQDYVSDIVADFVFDAPCITPSG